MSIPGKAAATLLKSWWWGKKNRGYEKGHFRSVLQGKANLFNIVAGLGRSFDEHHTEFLCLPFPLLHTHLPFVLKVSLVANQHNNDVIAPLGSDVFNPLVDLLEGVSVCRRGANPM